MVRDEARRLLAAWAVLIVVSCNGQPEVEPGVGFAEPDEPKDLNPIAQQRHRVLIGTVQTLSGTPELDTSQILAGYRLWVEHTNQVGGLLVGEDQFPVELRVLDDENDDELRSRHFNTLVEEDDVDFLLGGGPGSNNQMVAVGSSNEKVSIAISQDGWQSRKFAYNLQPVLPTSMTDFVLQVVRDWGYRRVVVLWATPLDSQGVVDLSPMRECTSLQKSDLGIQVVFEQSIDELERQQQLKETLAILQPEIAIACTRSEQDAARVIETLGLKQVLQGWNADKPWEDSEEDTLVPTFVESETLKFVYISRGATEHSFVDRLGGWAQKVLGPQPWHHEMSYQDRYLIDSQVVNGIWEKRFDLGNGKPMRAETAAAIAAGTVLRSAIEKAGSVRSTEVAAALDMLEMSTVFGLVSFDRNGSNVYGSQPVVQWDCSALVNCTTRVAVPRWATPRVMQPLHGACPPGHIRSSRTELFTVEYEPIDFTPKNQIGAGPVNLQPGLDDETDALPQTPVPIPCTPCVGGGEELDRLFDDGNDEQLRQTCSVLSSPLQIALLLSRDPEESQNSEEEEEEEELRAAADRAIETLRKGSSLLSHVRIEAFVPEEEEEDDAKTELKEIAETERGVLVWESSAPTLPSTELQRSVTARGLAGPFVTWMGVTVSLTPPTRQQGLVLASLVEHFGWRRCHVAYSSDTRGRAMLLEFKTLAEDRGIAVENQVAVEVRYADDEEDEEEEGGDSGVRTVAELDSCEASVLVLLLSSAEAEAVLDAMAERGHDVVESFVVLGSQDAALAPNAPDGMLAVRAVANTESEIGQAMVAEQDGRASGEGVRGGEVGHDDRRLFVYDAVTMGGEVAFSKLLEDFSPTYAEEKHAGIINPSVPHPDPLGAEDGESDFDLDLVDAVATGDLSENEHAQALIRTDTDGATGPLRFQLHASAEGDVIERVTGRFAVVNKVAGGSWRKLAYMDLEGSGAIMHSVSPELGQDAWERTVVAWGGGRAEKPEDVCRCVVWKRMGPHSSITTCRWSTEAIVTVGAGAVFVIGLVAALVMLSRKRDLDVQELLVQKRVKEVRRKLRMRKRDGFVLSSEARGLWFNLFHFADFRVIQRKQMEAVARMSLLYDFEVRAFDALASSLARTCRASPSPADEEQLRLVVSETSDDTPVHDQATPADDAQYNALRQLLLDTSRVLLDPHLDELQVRKRVGRSFRTPSGGRADLVRGQVELSSGASYLPGLSSEESVEHASSSALDMARTRVSMEPPAEGAITRTESEGADVEAASTPSGLVSRAKRGSAMMATDDELPQTTEQRFHFFARQVAAVQVWKDDGMSLFRELKEGTVQEFMDTIHEACDQLFSRIVAEPGGADLVAFRLRRTYVLPVLKCEHDGADVIGDVCELDAEASVTDIKPELRSPTSADTAATTGALHRSASASGGSTEIEEDATPLMDEGDAHKDHALVRAIRLDAEDWREVDLERSASSQRSPVKDEEVYISQLYRRAVLLNDEFQLRVRRAVGKSFHGRFEVHSAPVKTKARMREKLVSYAPQTPQSQIAHALDTDLSVSSLSPEKRAELPLAANILDPVRATIVCGGPEEMVECARWLCQRGAAEGLPVVRVKNKFAARDSSEYDGYRDLMVCVLYTGSHDLRIIAELQIHDRRLHDLKMRMHKLYKVKRAITPDSI